MSSPKPSSPAKGTQAAKNLSSKQIRRIWSDLKPQLLLDRLKSVQKQGQWSVSGVRVTGCCPIHKGTAPTFHVFLDRGYAKCFECDEYVWNPIQFWALVRGMSHPDALTDLKQIFGLKFLAAGAQTQLRDWGRHQLMLRKIMAICHDELINAINAPNDPRYSEAHQAVDWLINTRHLPKDALPCLDMLGVMPPVDHVTALLDDEAAEENARLQAVAEAESTKPLKFLSLGTEAAEYLRIAAGWRGAVVFRFDVAPDTIGRLKMQRPFTPSSDARVLDDAFEDEPGFFGLGWSMYRGLLGNQKPFDGFYGVEGEFDTLSIVARQALQGGPNFIALCLGGTASPMSVDSLRASGFTKGFLVGNRPDDRDGDSVVLSWLERVKHLPAYVFNGYELFPPQCGDPDAVTCTIGLPTVAKALLDTSNFATPPDWMYEKARPQIETLPDTDIRARVELASTWGKYLKNQVDLDLYVDACAKGLALPGAALKREIVAREEDEPAFILRLADVLTNVFYPFGQKATDSDRSLYLWHKEKRDIVKVGLADDASIERELGNKLGTSWQFFQDKVGIPPFLEVPEVTREQGKYLQKLDKDLRWYLRQALTVVSQNVPDFDTAINKGQGLHVDRNVNGPPTLYLVTGRDVFLGTFNEHDKLTWMKVDGPSYNGIIFDIGIHAPEKSWLPQVKSVEDLERAEGIDPQSLWDRLHPVLDRGWYFKNHATTVDFLTAHLMAATVNNAFRRQVMVSFQADTSAGKSKLNMGLIAGTEIEELHLIQSAVGLPAFTCAGIRHTMDNSVRPLCLDEVEDDGSGDKKSRTITELLEMYRNLTGENNTYTMGTRDASGKTYRLHHFVFLSSINPARKVQDANRMVVVQMDKRPNVRNPEDLLRDEFGDDFRRELKADLSIGLFPHIAKIHRVYAEIEKEFAKPGAKPVKVDTRFFQALYPALAVMKLLGKDYKKFALDFCEANKAPLQYSAEQTDSSNLLDWLLQSGELRIQEDGRDMQVNALQCLATPALRDKINLTQSGLYFDSETNLLIVNWTMAIQGVLRKHARYSKETTIFNLREIAQRSAYAVKVDVLAESGALARLRGFGLASVAPTHLTAYRVTHIVEGTDETTAPQQQPATPAAESRTTDAGDFTA